MRENYRENVAKNTLQNFSKEEAGATIEILKILDGFELPKAIEILECCTEGVKVFSKVDMGKLQEQSRHSHAN